MGVWGANYWAHTPGVVFTTDDQDLFLRPDVDDLLHIITSKHAAARDKDRLFLATHRDALEQLLKRADLK